MVYMLPDGVLYIADYGCNREVCVTWYLSVALTDVKPSLRNQVVRTNTRTFRCQDQYVYIYI